MGYITNNYGYLVIKRGWLDNTQTKWRLIAGEIIYEKEIAHCHV